MRRLRLVVSILSCGCSIPTVAAPGPQLAHVAAPPARAAQAAAAVLVQRGFTINVADASGGIVQAHREWQTTIDTALVQCIWAHPKSAVNTAMLVSVTAQPDSGGSTVTVRTDVKTLVGADAVFHPEAPGETGLCASTGAIERAVVAAAAR